MRRPALWVAPSSCTLAIRPQSHARTSLSTAQQPAVMVSLLAVLRVLVLRHLVVRAPALHQVLQVMAQVMVVQMVLPDLDLAHLARILAQLLATMVGHLEQEALLALAMRDPTMVATQVRILPALEAALARTLDLEAVLKRVVDHQPEALAMVARQLKAALGAVRQPLRLSCRPCCPQCQRAMSRL